MIKKIGTSWLGRFFLILVLIVMELGFNPAQEAFAATLPVTNTNDRGPGSLRQAIADTGTNDVTTFDPSLASLGIESADGNLDTTFGTNGVVTTDFNNGDDNGTSVVLQPDGRIILGGATYLGMYPDFVLARYMPDGSLDTTFDGDGKVLTDFGGGDGGYAIALQADGKILLAGTADYYAFELARYNSDGSLDKSFNGSGMVTTAFGQGVNSEGLALAVQPDGKIVMAGRTSSNLALVRYNTDGSLDNGFGVGGIVTTDFGAYASGEALVIQPTDGKIIFGGHAGSSIALARYNSDGSLDTTFDSDGRVITSVGTNDFIVDLALQPDGKILAVGSGDNSNGNQDFVLVRYNGDGSLDTNFDADGKVMTDFGSEEDGRAIAVQPDGRIVVTGAGDNRTTLALARYQSNGSLDPTFGVAGKVVTQPSDALVGYDVVLQPDQNIMVAGMSYGGSSIDFAVARYIGNANPPIPTSITIISDSPDPSEINQSVTVSVELRDDTHAGIPNALVEISGADVNCQITTNNNGSGSCNALITNTGVYELTATYSGDDAYLPSTDTETHTVVNPPPTVVSIVRGDPSPTSASSVNYTVTFSESVVNVGSGDFSLTTTGVTGAAIASVTGSGDSYTVTVNSGSGNGTIRLDLLDDDSIKDEANLPLGGVGTGNGDFAGGETYSILWITIAGNAGLADVTLSYTDGSPKTASTDGSGNYSFLVSYNWSGTVMPSNTGFSFSPPSKTYSDLTSNRTIENYTATALTYTISGKAGVAGAVLSYTDGSPKTATADGSGNYSFTISYNWSGTITPSKTGYTFSPANKTYSNVTENQTAQDYIATPITFIISGNAGTADVTLSYVDGSPKTATTDGSGNYSFTVSYNWSGTVTPSKIGFTFTPASREYSYVTTNKTAQNYAIPSPSASFDAWPLTINAGSSTEFHIVNTLNISTCSWDYGDGSAAGTLCSPYHTHTYAASGFYTVTLSVMGPGGTNSMTRARYITVYPTLVVNKTGNGNGIVTSNPAGINCGANCSGNFTYQTAVTLTAVAAPGSIFIGWSGGGCSGTEPCTVTVATAMTVAVHFEQIVASCPTITEWRGEYWVNSSLSGSPVLCRNDASLDFDWGAASPDASIPVDNFSAQWTKSVNFSGGRYQFYMDHDDGARLLIDDMVHPAVDRWGTCCVVDASDPILLSDGMHVIRIEYYEGGGAANARLWWVKLNPAVISITRADPHPTVASSVRFTVSFSESVTGVDIHDFSLTASGITGASVSGVTGSGTTRVVTVNTGRGNGTLRLNVADDNSIRNLENVPLGGVGPGNGNFTAGEAYTLSEGVNVTIGTQPTISSSVLPSSPAKIAPSNLQDGPVKVKSSRGVNIFTSERVIAGTSFNEVMGYPTNQLTTEYWFPWYDNLDMATWVLVGNASSTQSAAVDIYIGGVKRGSYIIGIGGRVTPRFPLKTGPVRVVSTNGVKIFTSERTQYGPNNAFNEVMGYPANQFTTEYWFPWYDNTSMATWILVGNSSTTSTATVNIYVGGAKKGTYSIPKGGNVTPRYTGLQAGPVRVVSTNGVKIFSSERTIAGDSFNEVMGSPANQFTTEYWYPWYDNVGMATWVLVGNPSTTQNANVDIYIGGVKQESYTIKPGKQINQRYTLNTGPVRVVSTNGVNIFSSERVLYGTGFNEVMGYAGNKLSTEYWFSWYDSTTMSTDILVGTP